MVRLLALAALPWLVPALPAQAQTAPATEVWLGCPAGHALETAPDPRILPAVANVQTPAPRLVVRCVSRAVTLAPVCPQGMRVLIALGADRCAAPRPSNNVEMGDGSVRTISDGSNTIMVGDGTSRTITDGSSNTAMIGEAPPPPTPPPTGASLTMGKGSGTVTTVPAAPSCIVPRRLVIDPAGSAADSCELVSVALPADRVPFPSR